MPGSKATIIDLLQPETKLEKRLLDHPSFLEGLFWGVPRPGHPEGEVYKHIREVLDNINQLDVEADVRRKLRLIAFVHDTFKHLEDKSLPRDWSKHHAAYARRFLASFTKEEDVLQVIELHDNAYHCWQWIVVCGDIKRGEKKFEELLQRLGSNLQLYYLFFKCDTLTGDKLLAPLWWFEEKMKKNKGKTNL